MDNALTIDLEDWYHSHDFNFPVDKWDSFQDRVGRNTETLLEVLDSNKTRSTFFILGCVAKKHPGLVREICEYGHEIACHGTWHRMVNTQQKEEFREDVLFSKRLLEDITGKPVNMYRAPSWSITSKNLWALEILEEEGFICDSSIQPFRTPLSGCSGAPYLPYHPVINDLKLKLVEFPPTVLPLGKFVFPFLGGLYLRILPAGFIIRALKSVNEDRAGMIYLHPWELDTKQPRVEAPLLIKFVHYHNIDKTINKVGRLLSSFKFIPLGELIQDKEFPFLDIKGV